MGLSRERALVLVPVVLAAALYGATAAGRAVLDVDEGLYVHAAQQMLARGDLVTPRVDGVRFLDKPPLLYWVLVGSYRLLGVTEFAAHLPPALAVVLTTWLLVRMTRAAAGVAAAFAAGLAFPFCIGTYLFTRETLHDGLLVLCLTWAMESLLRWFLDPAHPASSILPFYVALAGAALSKGLIGVVFALGIAAAFLLVSRERPALRSLRLGSGVVLFLLLAIPWHLLAAGRNPGFLRHYFLNEQVLRFLGSREPVDYASVPLPLFLAFLLVWLFPWSAFLPAVATLAWRPDPADAPRRALVRLMLSWTGLVLAFLSASTRLEHYAFPLLPPLAVLVGVALDPRAGPLAPRAAVAWGFRGLAALGLAAALTGACAAAWLSTSDAGSARGPWFGLRPAGDRPNRAYDTDFGPMADLPAPLAAGLVAPALGTLAALAVGLVGAWALERRGRRTGAVLSLGVAMGAFGAMAHASLRICEPVVSSRTFGVAIATRGREGDRVVVYGDYETANSINFYTPLPVEVAFGSAPTLAAGLAYPDAPRIILSPDQLASLWRGSSRMFLVVPRRALAGLGLPGVATIAESGGRLLVSNRSS